MESQSAKQTQQEGNFVTTPGRLVIGPDESKAPDIKSVGTALAEAGAQGAAQNSNPFIPVGSEISKEKLAASANMTQLLTNENYPSEGQDRSVSPVESGIPAMQSAAETSTDCASKFGRQW